MRTPDGLLVLAVMTSVIGPSVLPGFVVTLAVATLTAVGGTLAAAISVTFAYVLFARETPHVLVNGGWFIPPVVTIIPLALATLIHQLDGGNARLLLVLGYALYGLGLLLFLFMMGPLHDRLILHAMPGVPLGPSLGIALGPVGVGVLALLASVHVAAPILQTGGAAVVTISQLVSSPARRYPWTRTTIPRGGISIDYRRPVSGPPPEFTPACRM